MSGFGQAMMLAGASPLDHVLDKAWFAPGGLLLITNASIMCIVAGVLVYYTMMYIARRATETAGKAPSGLHNLFESVLQFVRKDIGQPVLGEQTDKFIPLLWTAFFFIAYCNLLGMVPLKDLTTLIFAGLGMVFFPEPNPTLPHGLGGTATGSIWVTGALALVTFVAFIAAGIRANGIKGFLMHLTGGVPVTLAFTPILVVIIIVEIIGLFVKPFALAMRLFANMTAGHVLLAVLFGFSKALIQQPLVLGVPVSIAALIGSLAISLLEIFVALLQAYIFTFLTALFIGQMVTHDEEHGDGHEHGHDHDSHHQHEAQSGAKMAHA